MMTALILYAHSQGISSSGKIARACVQRVDFMAVTGLRKPNFRTINKFRARHLAALSGLFMQVLTLCRQAGLASLGHVAIDGTKVAANASKHKADGTPGDESQRNFTDPDSKILKTADGYVQGYNGQLAVDADHRIIVAHDLTDQQNDVEMLDPALAQVKRNPGRQAKEVSADGATAPR